MADVTFTFRPIDVWPKSRTSSPKSNPFRRRNGYYGNDTMPWSDTLSLLTRELSAIEAKDVILQLALDESQITKAGTPYANARPKHHGVILSFKCKHGPLRYATDVYDHWQTNVRALAKALEALRLVDRYGVTSDGEQYAGWRQIEATSSAGPSVIDLGKALIARHGSVREAIKATHPDRGGDRAEFEAVQAAKEMV